MSVLPGNQPSLTARSPSAAASMPPIAARRSEEHTSELQSQSNLVCRLLLEKKNKTKGKTDVDEYLLHRHYDIYPYTYASAPAQPLASSPLPLAPNPLYHHHMFSIFKHHPPT